MHADDADPESSERRLRRLASTDLNLLVPLLLLLEERSVTRAAERAGLSQPALSHILKRSRALLGDELLIRGRVASTLTPRARALVAPLRELLNRSSDVLGLPSFDPRTDDRVVTLAATTTTAYAIARSLLARLAATAPFVTVALHVPPGIAGHDVFDDDRADVALLADLVAAPYPRRRLYTDRWVVVADRANERIPARVELAHLTELPHIVFDSGSYRTTPYAVMDALGLQRRIRARVSDFLLIPHLVGGSDAIAFVQERAVLRLAPALGLRVDELPFEAPPLGMDVMWNPRLGDDPLRRWFDAELDLAAADV